MELFTLLSQNSSLLSALQPPSLPTTPAPALQSTPPPPTQGRDFSRTGRGTGGVLVEKQKVSKDITAPAIKRKSLVDPAIEGQGSSISEVTGGTDARPAKCTKATKVRTSY